MSDSVYVKNTDGGWYYKATLKNGFVYPFRIYNPNGTLPLRLDDIKKGRTTYMIVTSEEFEAWEQKHAHREKLIGTARKNFSDYAERVRAGEFDNIEERHNV